ncbi:MAG: S1-like domain-containing RNA-binding protein [Verrucomicrobiota bacterium]
MIELGRTSKLIIAKEADPGYYLDGKNLGEILIPYREVPDEFEQGDELEVFIYRDSNDRLIATTARPTCEAGSFGSFEVAEVHPKMGAFLKWGLPKDLLLPFREQAKRVQPGDKIIAYVLVDEKTDRLVASTRIDRYLKDTVPPYRPGDAVSLLIRGQTPLGFNAIVDGRFHGLLYHSDLASPLKVGDAHPGYVRDIRPGGKLDLSLQPSGYQRVAPVTEQILKALEENGGALDLGDKSSPEAIREAFGTSKKAFKQALGALYKKKLIRLKPNRIESV